MNIQEHIRRYGEPLYSSGGRIPLIWKLYITLLFSAISITMITLVAKGTIRYGHMIWLIVIGLVIFTFHHLISRMMDTHYLLLYQDRIIIDGVDVPYKKIQRVAYSYTYHWRRMQTNNPTMRYRVRIWAIDLYDEGDTLISSIHISHVDTAKLQRMLFGHMFKGNSAITYDNITQATLDGEVDVDNDFYFDEHDVSLIGKHMTPVNLSRKSKAELSPNARQVFEENSVARSRNSIELPNAVVRDGKVSRTFIIVAIIFVGFFFVVIPLLIFFVLFFIPKLLIP